jgi:hypothetical protein
MADYQADRYRGLAVLVRSYRSNVSIQIVDRGLEESR